MIATALLGFVAAQETGFRSGPQPAGPGQPPNKVPGSFEVHTFNGRYADRFHSLVCENDAFPTALFFLKEPAEGKDAPVKLLFSKLDELVGKYRPMTQYPEVAAFSVNAVVVSEAAQTSLSNPKEDDPAALVKEATTRRAFYARMRDWAKGQKNVVVSATVPAEVKAYELNPKAELTGIFYQRFEVLDNFAFAEGTFKEEDVTPIVERIEKRLQEDIASRKKPSKK
jgi:hypothetical protein